MGCYNTLNLKCHLLALIAACMPFKVSLTLLFFSDKTNKKKREYIPHFRLSDSELQEAASPSRLTQKLLITI